MKIIIIGGSAAGMGVAAKLNRNMPNADIIVYQKNNYVSLGACGLPYFVSDNFSDPNIMIARTIEQFEDSGVKVNANHIVENVDFNKKEIYFKNPSGEVFSDNYDELIIAVGAKPFVPKIPGVDSKNVFTLTSLEDGILLKEQMLNNPKYKNIAIVGGGFIGLETAESLVEINKDVTIIEMDSRVSSKVFDKEISEVLTEELKNNNVKVLTSEQAVEFVQDNNLVNCIKLKSGKEVKTDAVIISAGFQPNTEFLKNTNIKTLPNGAIIVDQKGRTNIENVWSCGDCATSKNVITNEDIYSPLATVATKFSKVIADNISNIESNFAGSIQTSIVRCFKKEAARTGLNEQQAKDLGFDIQVVNISDKDHTNYVKNQSELKLKIIMDKKTRHLIGSQMVGQDKSVLRIGILVSMIWNKIKVDQFLEQIDLPYAPPFSKTTDIIHIALSKLNK